MDECNRNCRPPQRESLHPDYTTPTVPYFRQRRPLYWRSKFQFDCCLSSWSNVITMFNANQSPNYSPYSVYTPSTSPTTYFPQHQQVSPLPYPFQQSFPLPQVQSPYAHIPHTHSNLAILPSMSGYDDADGSSNHGGPSGNTAKRAMDDQDRKVSMDDGSSSKKKRISLSCAQCTYTSSGSAHLRCETKAKGMQDIQIQLTCSAIANFHVKIVCTLDVF